MVVQDGVQKVFSSFVETLRRESIRAGDSDKMGSGVSSIISSTYVMNTVSL